MNSCLVLRGIRWVVDSALLFFFARGGGGLSRGATSGLFNPFRRGALCALAPLFLFAWVLTAPEMAQSAVADSCTDSDPAVTEDAMGSRGGATVDPFVTGTLSGGPFTPQTDASDFTGTFEVKANGSWTFTLNNNHRFVQGLSRLYATCRTFVARPANGGAPVTQNIRVRGVDDPPTNLTLTWAGSVTHVSAAEGRISENTSTMPNVKVASLSAENKDFFEPPTFGVTGADAGYFVVVGSSLFLRAGTSLDRGAKSYYNFEVEATSGGSTLTSNTKTLTVGAARSARSAPGGPTVNPGNRKLEVSWNAPSDNGDSISGYNVRYRVTTTNIWRNHNPSITSTSTSATITGLTNGRVYAVQVRAINSKGTSADWSTEATGTPAAQPPDRPAKPTVTPGNRYLEVSWSRPSTNGAFITGYNLQYSEGNSDVWNPYHFASTSTTSIPIPMLTNGQSYKVQVRATSSAGDSYWSESATGTPASQPPDAPAKPTVTLRATASWRSHGASLPRTTPPSPSTKCSTARATATFGTPTLGGPAPPPSPSSSHSSTASLTKCRCGRPARPATATGRRAPRVLRRLNRLTPLQSRR